MIPYQDKRKDDGYTTSELGILLQSLTAKIDQFMFDNHEQHCEMNKELREHNGRLRKSEKAVLTLKVMIMTAVSIFMAIILPIMVWYANTVSASIDSLEIKIEQLDA